MTLTMPSAVLVSPTNNFNSNTRQPRFQWLRVTGATRYRIRVSGPNNQVAQFTINSGTTTSFTPAAAITFGGQAYWSVNARNNTVTEYGQPSTANQIRGITLPTAGGGNTDLTWTSPITTTNFPDLANTLVTSSVQRNRIENETIADIVSSVVIARDDNAKCTACHYQTTNVSQYYRPAVSSSSTTSISRTANYNFNNAQNGTSTWAVANGFADRFVQRHAGGTRANPQFGQKPTFLRKLIEKWIADGKKQ